MISTHVLDTCSGTPAAGISVKLRKWAESAWQDVEQGVTNPDGRVSFDFKVAAGVYQIVFEVEDYLKNLNREFFFVRVPVVFKIENTQRKYHIPLLLNPFGYSTYRGS